MATKSQVTTLDESTESEVATAVAEIKGANFDPHMSGDKRTITIHADNSDGGNDAVFVSVNGFAYQIPRGKPFAVPVEVVKVLENAKQDMMSFGQGGAIVMRSAPRFAFSLS